MIGLAMMLAAATSSLSYKTGEDLWRECNGPGAPICLGYLTGAVDSIVMMDVYYRAPHHFCVSQVPASQIMEVVVAYLKAHPEQRRFNASSIVWTAMGEAYPCPKV
jgi:hypothetical protein